MSSILKDPVSWQRLIPVRRAMTQVNLHFRNKGTLTREGTAGLLLADTPCETPLCTVQHRLNREFPVLTKK